MDDGVVLEPMTMVRMHSAQWKDADIDLDELASLRQVGWTSKRLHAHFGLGRTKINHELRKLREFRGGPSPRRSYEAN